MKGEEKLNKQNLKLRSAMVLKGKGIEEVAQAMGIKRGAFSLKLNGHREFKESEMEKISLFLQMPVTTLFFGEKCAKIEH